MPRPTLYDDDLRAALIGAGAGAVAEGGPSLMSLRSVARAAGTSTNAVYTLFGDKAGLVAAVTAEAAASFGATQGAVPVTDDGVHDLRELGRAYRRWAIEHPHLYAVMFGGRVLPAQCHDPVSLATADDSIRPLVAAVTRLVQDGTLAGAPVAHMVEDIWAGVHGMVTLETSLWSHRPLEVTEASFEAHLSATLRGWHATDDPHPPTPAADP